MLRFVLLTPGEGITNEIVKNDLEIMRDRLISLSNISKRFIYFVVQRTYIITSIFVIFELSLPLIK